MRDLDEVFARLTESPFRRRFRLRESELVYLGRKGMEVVLGHAAVFVEQRLAPASPHKDGKQTPFRGHPVFVAQHATGTCCRGCLEKWHGIPRGKLLDESEKQHVVEVIGRWLSSQASPE